MNSLLSKQYKKWIRVAVFNFMLAAVMGLLLRAAFVWDFEGLEYKNMLHAHSHIAMLGWIYMALYLLIVHAFIPKKISEKHFYNRLFWLTQITVVGMMFSFPIQGYDTYSILFSTAHLLLSYVFAIRVWRDTKKSTAISVKLLRLSLISLFVSTIGLLAIPIIINTDASQITWYYIAIQFYLHFQFNGWFILALLAVLVKYFIENKQHILREKSYHLFTWFYLPALVFTFFHVITWAYAKAFSYVINGVGVFLQLIAVGILVKYVLTKAKKTILRKQNNRLLILFALLSVIIKVVIQFLLIIPELARVSTEIRNFMIGYIHLINLGIISSILFYVLYYLKILLFRWEIKVFLLGIFATEVYLFLQGYFYWQALGRLPYYHLILFLLSIPLLLGIILIYARNISDKKILNNL